jgi:hypothetical protein
MRTRILIVIGIVIVVAVVVFLAITIGRKQAATPSPTPNEANGILPAPAPVPPAPTGDRIDLQGPGGSVSVKNFYPNSVEQTADSVDVLETDDYSITYFRNDASFLITLLNGPFDTVRPKAEAAFLQTLDIQQSGACKLVVSIATPSWVDAERGGTNYGLSFCPLHATQQ